VNPTSPPSPRVSDRTRRLVVGLGSVDRGDDAAGPIVAGLVADELAAHGPDDIEVVEHEDPTALVELMSRFDAVVVVDAVRSGAPPGTVSVRTVDPHGPALPARAQPGPAGTHGLGLASAIELARALDRLPQELTIVGIDSVGFGHGQPLSEPVLQAVPDAVGVVLAQLEEVPRDVP
jgi:hydrogenase maturation protease